ncbi:MAG: DUF4232 domain-containing protein [Actinophytocola sp.]|nr:DUF4232 domain-containing protein [Actinophytocola sp.]
MAHRPAWRSGLRGLGVLALVAVFAAGCGESGQPSSGSQPTSVATTSPSPTTSSSPPTTSTSTTTPSPSPSPASGRRESVAPQADSRLCTSGDVSLSLGPGRGAAGTIWRALRFTNVSGESCDIQGFPGVSYVAGDDGHQVGAAAYRDGSEGAVVTLADDETAYAAVGFAQVGNYDPRECRPTKVRGLRVYPPQETESKFVPYAHTGCANANLTSEQLRVQTIRPGTGPS